MIQHAVQQEFLSAPLMHLGTLPSHLHTRQWQRSPFSLILHPLEEVCSYGMAIEYQIGFPLLLGSEHLLMEMEDWQEFLYFIFIILMGDSS